MNDKILNIHWINKQGKRIKRHRNKVDKYHNFKSIKITMGRGKKSVSRIENKNQIMHTSGKQQTANIC